ncbi:MAG TPA: winged helix-turn-helix transcriptional regulator, partial [Clostridiales bacterium]|nr:winged helix-turn-helix transcriptional regulator [Clostridiales bacterium]
MADNKILLADNEYVIMSEVVENEYITQRELSKKLGVSVSTVNVLMNKMIREGLIKMTQVSQKQVLYMLTPVGMMEKAKKTVTYL